MFERIVNEIGNMFGSAPAAGANAGGPARMGDAGSGHAAPSGGDMGGALGAAVARVNAATSRSLPPSFATCPEDRLPLPAREKYRSLEEEAAASYAVNDALHERLAAARAELARHEARVAHVRSEAGGRLGEGDPAFDQARGQVEVARAEVARIAAEIARRKEASSSVRQLFGNLERYVVSLRGVTILAAEPVAAAGPRAGETWSGLIEAKRQRLQKLIEDRQSIIDAPRPSSVAKQMARQEIEELSRRGRPSIMALLEGGDAVGWPTRLLPPMMIRGADGAFAGLTPHDKSATDVLALLCWTLRDELIARLDAEIDEHADDKSALDPATREKKRRQVEVAILEAERVEEATICAAAEAGVRIERRPDADPRAILGLSDSCPPPDRGLL